MSLFGRRRVLDEATRAAIRDAKAAALRAEQAATTIAAYFAEESALRQDEHRRRTVLLFMSALGSLIVAGLLTVSGSRAFDDPIAVREGYATVEVAWQTEKPHTAEGSMSDLNKAKVWISADTDEDFGTTNYEVTFPPAASGQQFVVILKSSAELGNPHSDSTDLSVEHHDCGTDPVLVEDCQFVYGIVPSRPELSLAACGVLHPTGGQPMVRISGDTSAVSSLDWYHHVITAPSIQGPGFATVAATYEGVTLPATFEFANPDGCKSIEVQINRRPQDVSQPPTVETSSVARTSLVWSGEDVVGNADLVTKARYADSYGQVTIAVGAGLAGLGIGLIPVAFGAFRENKRRDRRSALQATSTIDRLPSH